MECSIIHLVFFDLVGKLISKACDAEYLPFDFAHKFRSFQASEIHGIPLFSEKFLKKITSCELPFFVQLYVLQFATWIDNSLIKELVMASESELAMKIFNKFDASLDYNLPITSYPIPSPSQLIMPLDDSNYTIVATKHTQSLREITVNQVKVIKMLLINNWQITEHAVQLIALCATSSFLYWMIPKRIAHLITQCGIEVQHKLLEEGIIMINLFPSTFFSDSHDLVSHSLSMGPFSFLSTCLPGKNMMVRKSMCFMHATANLKFYPPSP